MAHPDMPEDAQGAGGRPADAARIESPSELLAGGDDAGAPKGCTYQNRHYKDGDTRRGQGVLYRCTNGEWIKEDILDPSDPWKAGA